MYARSFSATILSLTVTASAQSPPPPAAPTGSNPAGPPQAASDAEAQRPWRQRMAGYFGLTAPDLDDTARLDFRTPVGGRLLDAWMLAEPARPAEVAVTSEESFDIGSRSHVVKHVLTVPVIEESKAVVVKLQARQAARRGPLDLDYVPENAVVATGTVTIETTLLDRNKDPLEVGLVYRYDLDRAHEVGATVTTAFPNVLLPSVKHEVKVNATLAPAKTSLCLAIWTRFTTAARRPLTITATVDVRRQEARSGSRRRESYALDWGGLVKVTERLSTGLNLSYTWDSKGIDALLFVEMKSPTGGKTPIRGGFYDLAQP